VDIKAIKTVYNGYLFRSRLEARWAVFFDELKIKYEYEPEMAEVGRIFVQNYIPDFFLPEIELYIEIKGQEPTENEIRKAAGWANDTGPVLILYGGMDRHGLIENRYKNSMLLAFPWKLDKPVDIPTLYKGYAFCECPRCGVINIGREEMPDICNPSINDECKCFTLKEIEEIDELEEKLKDGRISKKLMGAYEKAKYFKFNDPLQKNYKNNTNKQGGAPTQKMINYAKHLCDKNNCDIEGREIEDMSFQGVSDLINDLKKSGNEF
jgi:hypothetical protein